jgi:hypothetical protein
LEGQIVAKRLARPAQPKRKLLFYIQLQADLTKPVDLESVRSEIEVNLIAPFHLGSQHQADKSESHGGIPVCEFIDEAMRAIENDILQAPIGMAKGLHEKWEALFDAINR